MDKLKLELSLEHINIILAALGEGAFKVVQPVINAIQEQATVQLQAQAQSSDDAEETPKVSKKD